jgi:hypothetical protein
MGYSKLGVDQPSSFKLNLDLRIPENQERRLLNTPGEKSSATVSADCVESVSRREPIDVTELR